MYLLLAFVLVPILEIAVFIQVGGFIGVWPTIAIVLLTAFAGTALLRAQGFAVLRRAQAQLARHELPVGEVFDGVCLLVAGVLLLTPGFVTDSLGLLLFIPAVRRRLGKFALKRLLRSPNLRVFADGAEIRPRDGVIEGEWREVGPDAAPEPPPADSKWRPPHPRNRS